MVQTKWKSGLKQNETYSYVIVITNKVPVTVALN